MFRELTDTTETFQGIGWMDGGIIGIPGQVRLGGLAVLVEHNQSTGGPVPQILSFPPGVGYQVVDIGPNGATMSFVIVDKPGSWVDNHGICSVDVVDVDPPHLDLFQTLCDGQAKADPGTFTGALIKCGLGATGQAWLGTKAGPGWMGLIGGAIGAGVFAMDSADCKRVNDEFAAFIDRAIGITPGSPAEPAGSGEPETPVSAPPPPPDDPAPAGPGGEGPPAGSGDDHDDDHDDHGSEDHDHGEGFIGTSSRLHLRKLAPRAQSAGPTAKKADLSAQVDVAAVIRAFGDSCKEIIVALRDKG